MTQFQSGLKRLAEVFDQLGIAFLVGGSVASSVYGVVRATLDIDVLAAIQKRDLEALGRVLIDEFYADVDQMHEALKHGRAFNVVHHSSGQKIDIFPAVNAFHTAELERGSLRDISVGAEILRVPVATPEDILIAKLVWFHSGGEVSDRQWTDILGLIRVRRRLLDFDYVRHWARELGIEDLLDRALRSVEYH
jgi:hypothetical protein